MSRWTHIRGGLELGTSPFRLKNKTQPGGYGSKNVYLPKPNEQVELKYPRPTKDWKTNELKLSLRMFIYSLPIAKPIIEKAFELLPQGESDWSYSILQNQNCSFMSGSQFDYPCEEKIFYQKVKEMFKGDYICNSWVDVDMIDYIEEIILGIREDVRYCSGEEMLEGLEKFFLYLRENEIHVEDGYLEWEDEYVDDYFYCWRCSRVSDDIGTCWSFHKIDRKTNKILWTKNYKYKDDKSISFDSELIAEEINY